MKRKPKIPPSYIKLASEEFLRNFVHRFQTEPGFRQRPGVLEIAQMVSACMRVRATPPMKMFKDMEAQS